MADLTRQIASGCGQGLTGAADGGISGGAGRLHGQDTARPAASGRLPLERFAVAGQLSTHKAAAST